MREGSGATVSTVRKAIVRFPSGKPEGDRSAVFTELERRVHWALGTYSNVHRGTGYQSEATTVLYECARDIVLRQFGLSLSKYVVVFTSSLGTSCLGAQLRPDQYRVLSSQDLGLPLGVRALAVKRSALPKRTPPRTGGGTAKLVSANSVIWADVPDRFEAGTPGIVNVIALACALQMTRRLGMRAFRATEETATSVENILYHDEYSALSGLALLSALRESMVGHGIPVPINQGAKPYTNLDNAASTPAFSPVWDSVCRVWRQSERTQREVVGEVKQICAEFLGASSEEYAVIFTSNTTEALNVVAGSLEKDTPSGIEPIVLNTWLEHNSNELPWRSIPGGRLLKVSVDDEGFVDVEELDRLLREYNSQHEHGTQRIVLLAISGASNVLGSYNDLENICRIVHQYGARVLVDAAQLAAHRRIEMGKWGIDYLALSGHKLYAPFGSGALVVRKEVIGHSPFVWGQIRACGEENVIGIAAMGKAMVLLRRVGMDTVEAEERRLTLRVLDGLSRLPSMEIWGVSASPSSRLQQRGGIVAFSLKNVPHNRVARELAERGGIGVRTGCHCAHLLVQRLLKIHPRRVKVADLFLRLFPDFTSAVLPGVVRVSLGIGNDEHDIEHFLRIMKEIVDAPRSRMDRRWAATHNGTPFLGRSRIAAKKRALLAALVTEVYASGKASVDGGPSSVSMRSHGPAREACSAALGAQ
jgi:selenocysteine lyase/cysteine desulfurase